MARRIRLATHLSVEELKQRYRAAQEPHERTWWQIVCLLARGQTATRIAEGTGYTRSWIWQIAKRYNAEGPGSMVNRQRTTSWRPHGCSQLSSNKTCSRRLLGRRPAEPSTGPLLACPTCAHCAFTCPSLTRTGPHASVRNSRRQIGAERSRPQRLPRPAL